VVAGPSMFEWRHSSGTGLVLVRLQNVGTETDQIALLNKLPCQRDTIGTRFPRGLLFFRISRLLFADARRRFFSDIVAARSRVHHLRDQI
jgi:hypothetical protein